MRKITLLLTLGLFLSVTAANACDGEKAAKGTKTKKASAACMKNGKCTMTAAEMKKSGCCAHEASASATGAATTSATAKAGCEAKAGATGSHKCCKAKTEAQKS